MNRKILKNIFDNLEQSLYSDMSIRIEHNLEDGKYREYLVTKVLQKIIPSKYSITNGFIIDSDNNISQEMDVIIYDKNSFHMISFVQMLIQCLGQFSRRNTCCMW